MIPKNQLIIGSIFLGGIVSGVLFNFTVNKNPAPKEIVAANPTPTPTKTPTPTPTPTNTPTPTPTPSYTISGKIFIDNNANGKESAQDSNYTVGATISATLNAVPKGSTVSLNTGKFTIAGLYNGTYSLLLTVPDGYRTTTDNPITQTITNGNIATAKFGIVPTNWNIPTSEKFVMCRDLRQFVKDHCE